MADDVTFTLNADSTPPAGTKAATDEITVGPHAGAHAGVGKLAVSADGDGTHIPATVADGLLVNLGANNDVTVTGTVSVTEPVSVDDNGGSLTVDAPLGTPVNVQVGDGANTATVRNLAANDALNVALVDGAGGQITTFGAVSHVDDATFTVAVDDVVPVAGIYRSSRDSVDDNDAGAVAMTQRRALLEALDNSDASTAAWTNATANNTALSIDVKNYGAVALSFNPSGLITAGSINFEASDDEGVTWYPVRVSRSDTVKIETALALNGETLKLWTCNVHGFTDFRIRLNPVIAGAGTANLRVQAVAVGPEVFSPVTIVDGSGDVQAFAPDHTLATGPMSVRLANGAAFTDLSIVDETAGTAVDAVAVGGGTPHDAVDSGNPLKLGGRAETTAPTAVGDADRVNAFFDEFGRLVTRQKATAATKSAVADNAADVQLLASNPLRQNFSVTNDSTAVLYLSYGSVAASTTSYTVQVPPNSFYSDDMGFTGEIRGIWASDPNTGAARITELTT